MALETGDYISALVATNPLGSDPKSDGDGHLRFIKEKILQTFPNVDGEVDRTPAQLNKAGVEASETVTGIAEIATQAETEAGTDDNLIVTPLKLRFGFALLLASSGYCVFPKFLGGWVIQWGSATAAATGRATGSWPMAFPSALYAVVANGSGGASSTAIHAATRGSAASLSNYDFWLSAAVAHVINYIAIGK